MSYYLPILIYVFAVASIALFARGKGTKSGEGFFLADRSIGWVFLGFTIFASWMSTFAFLGSPGLYFKIGTTWYLPHSFLVVASPLLMWIIGRRLWTLSREKKYVTPSDFFRDRYQSKTLGYTVAVVCIVALVPYCAIQLIGVGKAIHAGTGGAVPYWSGVLVAALGVSFYSSIGGIRAVIWSDCLQGILFVTVIIIGLVKVILLTGGLGDGYALALENRPEAFLFNPEKMGTPITLLFIWTFGFILLPHMWQRVYMAKDRKSFGRSILLSACLAFFFICIPSMLVGTLLIGVYDISAFTDTDQLIPTFFADYLSSALPLLFVATFAAGMSTIDSQLMSASSIITNDIIKNKESEKEIKRAAKVGRVCLLFFLILLIYIALSDYARENIVFIASKGTGIAFVLLVPTLFALYAKRPIRAVGLSTLFSGIFIQFVLEAQIVSYAPMSFGAPIIAGIFQLLIGTALTLTMKNDYNQQEPQNESTLT